MPAPPSVPEVSDPLTNRLSSQEWLQWPFFVAAVCVQYGLVYAFIRWRMRSRDERYPASPTGSPDELLRVVRWERGLLKGFFLFAGLFVFVVLSLREIVTSGTWVWPFVATAWIAGIGFTMDLACRHHADRLNAKRESSQMPEGRDEGE